VKFGDIEDVYLFVDAHQPNEASAHVSLKTGKIYCISDTMDEQEVPDDLFESEEYVEIPNRYDLDLGKDLVFRFVRSTVPDDFDEVRDIFSRRGAYGRFKAFLDRRNLLDRWHEFEDQEIKRALREWCRDHGIDLDEDECRVLDFVPRTSDRRSRNP
jgi:hypothetical protein